MSPNTMPPQEQSSVPTIIPGTPLSMPKKTNVKRLLIIVLIGIIALSLAYTLFLRQDSVFGPLQDHGSDEVSITTPLAPTSYDSAYGSVTVDPQEPCPPQNDTEIVEVKDGVYTKGFGLFVQQDYEKPNPSDMRNCPNTYPHISYLEQGIVPSGQYKGYHRIIGFRTFDGPGEDGPTPYFFVTKDYKDYKIVKNNLSGYGSSADAHAEIIKLFDKTKVSGVIEYLDFSFPQSIVFGSFTYELRKIRTESPKSSQKLGVTANGLEIYETILPSGHNFGAYGYDASEADRLDQKAIFDGLNVYLSGRTQLSVKDTSGIFADYEISINAGGVKQNINIDRFTTSGGVSIKKDEHLAMLYAQNIKTDQKLFATYAEVVPSPCTYSGGTYISKTITDQDIEKIAETNSGIALYTVKDKQHPLLKAQYIEKVSQYSADIFASINERYGIKTKPTYDQFVAQNPILLLRDPWNRLVILGESEYAIEGGCGKPVIYLYPEKPTDVSVSFKNDMRLTTDIPTYGSGWSMHALPDGTLRDLNQSRSKEECAGYLNPRHGSEYAYDACVKNAYPYIYWSGDSSNPYPIEKNGFIVSADDLMQVLEEKLRMIGLSPKEIDDMVSYWHPEMMRKNAPYYRISFFDTATLNGFIPMNVIPRPDTVIRTFLDWEPLSKNEAVQKTKTIQPQTFKSVKRKGFTYVEWGGLKR